MVLPEVLNQWRGNGPNNPNPLSVDEMALEDWEQSCAKLIECAAGNKVAVTVPVFVREGGQVFNVFYLVDESGGVLGRPVVCLDRIKRFTAMKRPHDT